jgi:PKD repeat protein
MCTPGRLLPVAATVLLLGRVSAQCPELYDYFGNPSNAPLWYSCSGTDFTLLIASPDNIGNYSISWGDGSPMDFGSSLVPPNSVTHLYTAAVATYTVTFTDLDNGCVINGTLTMEESTSASIQIPIGGLTQVCAPQTVDFINSSTNVSPNTTFVWDFGDGSPPLNFDYTNLGQTIPHLYQPGTVSCETEVRLYAQNECNVLQGGASLASFFPIRIWDKDSADITPSATLLCWPDNTVTFVNTTDRNCLSQGNIYQRYEWWNFGDYWGLGTDSIINWTPWPPTFPRTISYPGIGSYTVTLLDSNYCGIDTTQVTINIVPPPSVTLTVTPDTLCEGGVAFFNQTTNGGANSFQWNFGTGAGWQNFGGGDQTRAYNNSGNYTISFAASIAGATAGCADTASVDLVVLPSPTSAFVLDTTAACNSLTVTPTNASINGVDFLWDFGDGTTSTAVNPGPHTYTTTNAYNITLTATNSDGCSHVSQQVVYVYDPPNVQIGAANVCDGDSVNFADLTVTQPGNTIIGWNWDFGDGNTDTVQGPTHLYAAPGPYTVTLTTNTPYCSGTGTLAIQVEQKPVASFTPDVVLGCSPLAVQFNNTSANALNYVWAFGDGAVSNTPSPAHTYLNFGSSDSVYTAQLVAVTAFGCRDTVTTDITVSPFLNALFVHDGVPGCAPFDVTFTNLSTGAATYAWDFGDGTTSTLPAPTHQYVNNTLLLQTFDIVLVATAAAGCVDSAYQQILVYPTADFALTTPPDSGCAPLSVTFPSVTGAISYQWDFGDGSSGSGPAPTHTYINLTSGELTFTVTMVASNAFGCSDTATTTVTAFPLPQAFFALSNIAGCQPLTGTLTNASTGATTYLWDYGDGATSDTSVLAHDHTWSNTFGTLPEIYNVELTAFTDRGCTDAAQQQVQVFPSVTASFVADSAGCSPFDPDMVNFSQGAVNYLWLFGDGGSSGQSDPAHLYLNQGLNDQVYQPMLIATSAYGCSDTATAEVRVHPSPIAQFVPSTLAACTPAEISFQDITIGANGMQWDFGDGTTLQTGPGNVSHTYINPLAAPQTRLVNVLATTLYGCVDTASVQVQIHPAVTAAFTMDTVGCAPFPVVITNNSIGAVSYLWNMGDGNVFSNASPSYTYFNNTNGDLIYTITMVATSAFGCTDTTQQQVLVAPVPFASFLATPVVQQYPNATVNINNTSAPGPWSYAWAFGDGNTSNQEEPVQHTYGTWGEFTITLVVGGALCSDTLTQVIEITPPAPTASFIGSAEGCVPLTITFQNTSLMAESYAWNFGDGGTSSADSPTYTYFQPGIYTVSMTATSPQGGLNTAIKVDSIVVHPSASAFFVLQPNNVIIPNEPVFTYNLSGNATNYQWDFGDGNTSTEFSPVHFYQVPGEFDVQLIANNEHNCPDTFLLESATTAIFGGDIDFPNAFTPGNSGPTDGVYDPDDFSNNYFFPTHEGVVGYHLQVYNRWGEMVFETFDVLRGWDGYYRGEPAKQDVYVWKAKATFLDGREELLTGDVTLLR